MLAATGDYWWSLADPGGYWWAHGGEGLKSEVKPGQQHPGDKPEQAGETSQESGGHSLEIELKLAGPANDLERLWISAIAPQATTSSRHLVSTYHDTSDFRLRRRGYTLRVREDAGEFVQTVKALADASQGVLARGEWSARIDGPVPDLRRLGDQGVRERIGLLVPGELAPIFTTDITRRVGRYRVNGGAQGASFIEAALDEGEIRANGKAQAISEIELELLEGSPIALRQEAARLHRKSPLQYQPLTKADRGFALARGERPRSRKAKPPELTAEESVDEALECVLVSCVSHWLANHAAVLNGGDTEGVHQMRVALRRMRSALTIFKNVLPDDDLAWLQREAKALIKSLGGARDWDVFVDELLRPVMEARPEDGNLKILSEAVDEERRLANLRARAALRSPAYLTFILELGAWLESRGWRRKERQAELDRKLIDLADEVLHKRHRQAMKLGRNFERLPDEALHRLRISLKKLRYATEFFAGLYGEERTAAYLEALRQLQDDLGHLNDLAVAENRLADLCGRNRGDNAGALQLAYGTVVGWHSQVLARIRPRIIKDWRDFTHAGTF